MVVRETSRVLLMGVALGLVIALCAERLVESQLFGLTPYDPFAVLTALALMLGIALFSAYLPARRATRIDPVAALRNE
jgi:ABC-type antimicrobial peptide transport system permease subunit